MSLSIQLLLAFGVLIGANRVAAFDDIMYDVHQQLQVRRMVQDENSYGLVALTKRENNEFMDLLDSETTHRRKRENHAAPNIAVDPPEYATDPVDRKKRENSAPPNIAVDPPEYATDPMDRKKRENSAPPSISVDPPEYATDPVDRKRRESNAPPNIAVDPPEYGPEKRSPNEQPGSASEEGVAKRELQSGPPQPESASEEGVAKRRKRRDINPSSLSKSTRMEARRRRDVGILLGDPDSPYDQHKYHCWGVTSPDMCLQLQGCEWKSNYCYVPYSSMSKIANDYVLKWLLRDI